MTPDSARNGGVSVLMPAYNVGPIIADNAARVAKALIDLDDVEIIVCNDGSADQTGPAADEAAEQVDVLRVVHHTTNQGKGAALRSAFAASTGETVVFLDGDLDLPPEQLPMFVETFYERDVDALVGEKAEAMRREDYPAIRRVLSRTYSTVVSLLFRIPVRETQTGLKAFRRAAIADVMPSLTINRYTFDLELLGRMVKNGATIDGAAVTLAPDAATTGLSAATLYEMARDTLLTWWRLQRRG